MSEEPLSPEATDAIKKYLDNMAGGFKTCPFCDAVIEKKEQVGRCVYALPCGHRLYQGKLAKEDRNMTTTSTQKKQTHFTRADEHPHAVLTDSELLFMEAGKVRRVEEISHLTIGEILGECERYKIATLWIQPGSIYGRMKASDLQTAGENWNIVPGVVTLGHEEYLRTVSARDGKTWVTVTWPEFSYEWHDKWSKEHSQPSGKDMLAAIQYLGKAFDLKVHHNPGVMGRELMERGNKTERRAEWIKRPDFDFSKLPLARGDGFTYTAGIEDPEGWLAIWRAQHNNYQGKLYIHARDCNSQFPNAAKYVELPGGKPDFAYEADNGDWLGALFRGLGVEMKKRPDGRSWDIPAGIWDIGVGFSDKPRSYAPFFQEMNPLEPGQHWVTTPMLKLLYQEEIPTMIYSAWVWPGKHILFDDFADDFWKARQSLKNAEQYPYAPGRELAYYSAKQVGTKGIGLLSSPLTQKYNLDMFRPDWRLFIIEEAKVRAYYTMKKFHRATGDYPLFVATDEVHILSPESDPDKAFAGCFSRPNDLGGYKDKFSIEVTPEVLACYHPEYSAGKTIVQLRRFQ